MNIFKYNNYRTFIDEWLESSHNRGQKSSLAKAASCSPSWITRVLSESVQLTPDQALGIANYMQLTELEVEYFLSLVDFERAASIELKKRLSRKMDRMKSEGQHFSSAVKKTEIEITEEKKSAYYSSWIYQALHVACMIQSFTAQEIAERFQLTLDSTAFHLNELKSIGLVTNDFGKWKATHANIHLNSQSHLTRVTHMNWRNKTIQNLQQATTEPDHLSLHYSGVHNLSKKDLEKIRAQLKEVLLSTRKQIEKSPEETLAVFCLDWYEL